MSGSHKGAKGAKIGRLLGLVDEVLFYLSVWFVVTMAALGLILAAWLMLCFITWSMVPLPLVLVRGAVLLGVFAAIVAWIAE